MAYAATEKCGRWTSSSSPNPENDPRWFVCPPRSGGQENNFCCCGISWGTTRPMMSLLIPCSWRITQVPNWGAIGRWDGDNPHGYWICTVSSAIIETVSAQLLANGD